MRQCWCVQLISHLCTQWLFVQCCIFGVCIPLDIVLPGILAAFYYFGIDVVGMWNSLLVMLGVRNAAVNNTTDAGDEIPADEDSSDSEAPEMKSRCCERMSQLYRVSSALHCTVMPALH